MCIWSPVDIAVVSPFGREWREGGDVSRRKCLRVAALVGALVAARIDSATAETITWADWTAATVGASGSALGSITSASGTTDLVYSGEVSTPTQVAAGVNYWMPSTPYLNSTIDNAPPCCDIITLRGGTTQQNTLMFSSPVVNPVMAIVSLGQPGFQVSYQFGQPFEVLSSGPGFWGGPGTLTQQPGGILAGNEGHGAIRFLGSLSSISWTVPTAEFWHGYTVGVPAAQAAPVPEPATLGLLGLGLVSAVGHKLRSFRRKNAD
jgi:hypothetical protein